MATTVEPNEQDIVDRAADLERATREQLGGAAAGLRGVMEWLDGIERVIPFAPASRTRLKKIRLELEERARLLVEEGDEVAKVLGTWNPIVAVVDKEHAAVVLEQLAHAAPAA